MTQLFQNVLTASFHGSVVILAVLALRLMLKKTPKKFLCLLWLLAGLRLLLPFEIRSDLSLQPQMEPVYQQTVLSVTPPMAPVVPVSPAVPGAQDWPRTEASVRQEAVPTVREEAPVSAPEPERKLDVLASMPYIWAAVAACFLVYTLLTYARIRYLVREAVYIPNIPGAWECDRIETAFVLGFLRPQVYLPMGLPESVRGHILAHERTHLEKGDHWFKMIGFLALAIHWFNPLVWVAYALLCKDIELACDERVVQFMSLKERKEYSKALLDCSTRRVHYGACPIAFGEVSIKERILVVLNYKKPGFWISLAGVAAICFVAVCLVTSPEAKTPDAEVPSQSAEEAAPMQPTEAVVQGNFTDTLLTENDITAAVQAGLEAVMDSQSYFITKSVDLQMENSQSISLVIENHKSGEDLLSQIKGEERNDGIYNSYMIRDGIQYSKEGQNWLLSSPEWQRQDFDPDDWLEEFLPQEIMITYPEGTGILDGSTVAYRGQWVKGSTTCFGDFTVTFDAEGRLSTLVRKTDMGELGQETIQLTFHREQMQDIETVMQTIADSALTSEEIAEQRILEQQVSEVPSNKTDYDKDFMLGAGQMGWNFLGGEWFFKFGAEKVTPEGMTLMPEYNGPYGSQTIPSGSVEASGNYFLERQEDGLWVTVPAVSNTFQPIAKKTFRQMAYPNIQPASDGQIIRWQANYGSLDAGFYRLGNYYTFHGPDGQTDTQVCYAKFRIYDPNQDALLSQAKAAIDDFVQNRDYHIQVRRPALENDSYSWTEDIWKQGSDYLSATVYTSLSPTAQARQTDGALYREGRYYGLTWDGENIARAKLTDWWLSERGYMDSDSFQWWARDYDWYDSKVELVYQEKNAIHILETYDFDEKYACEETVVTLDESGGLQSLTKCYQPTRNCAEREKVPIASMRVMGDNEDAIRQTIEAVDTDQPMAFDYAADLRALEDGSYSTITTRDAWSPLEFTLVTDGLRNTAPQEVGSASAAQRRADRESRLPQLMEFRQGYCQSRTYYDAAAGIWKVELYWWQNDDCYQAVYLDSSGITQGIVTVQLADG